MQMNVIRHHLQSIVANAVHLNMPKQAAFDARTIVLMKKGPRASGVAGLQDDMQAMLTRKATLAARIALQGRAAEESF
jgi:hypothetical protein